MREICTSGSMSGEWKRSMAELVRHRQTKEPEIDRLRLNHRATPRLYLHGNPSSSKPVHPSPQRKQGNTGSQHSPCRIIRSRPYFPLRA